jgi:hypothetical protein
MKEQKRKDRQGQARKNPLEALTAAILNRGSEDTAAKAHGDAKQRRGAQENRGQQSRRAQLSKADMAKNLGKKIEARDAKITAQKAQKRGGAIQRRSQKLKKQAPKTAQPNKNPSSPTPPR